MARFVTYGEDGGYVVGRVEDYLDAESRRNPTPVSTHDDEDEAVAEMRRRNREEAE